MMRCTAQVDYSKRSVATELWYYTLYHRHYHLRQDYGYMENRIGVNNLKPLVIMTRIQRYTDAYEEVVVFLSLFQVLPEILEQTIRETFRTFCPPPKAKRNCWTRFKPRFMEIKYGNCLYLSEQWLGANYSCLPGNFVGSRQLRYNGYLVRSIPHAETPILRLIDTWDQRQIYAFSGAVLN